MPFDKNSVCKMSFDKMTLNKGHFNDMSFEKKLFDKTSFDVQTRNQSLRVVNFLQHEGNTTSDVRCKLGICVTDGICYKSMVMLKKKKIRTSFRYQKIKTGDWAGKSCLRGRFSTVDLFIKIGCFVK
jgi:hypothetical protein